MPTTRKKVIKTVYKDEDDSEVEDPYSDSGSEAHVSEASSSEEDIEEEGSSGEEFVKSKTSATNRAQVVKKAKFAKSFINRISNKKPHENDEDGIESTPTPFSIKDLTDEDKLLPSVLNLSESDSSDDESQKPSQKQTKTIKTIYEQNQNSDSDNESHKEYKDVWSSNLQDNSEEIARKAFLELEQHKSKLEETKASVHDYTNKQQINEDFDVKDLLAQGEEVLPKQTTPKKKIKPRNIKGDSDSEIEDWEEVKESKSIPQQGLQLIVDFPGAVCRKSKKIDVEMMMKRKINRVKKEYQVYMHKVHVLCWLGHGNYVSKVLNDQELLAVSLSLVPSKDCYPGERVDMKYLEQITTWYKDKFTLKQDKNENKFKPKAPSLKDILISQIKSRVATTRKYLVYIFVCMLRALGLQCRVIFNFVTLPIKPPSSELCSLSTKPKNEKTTGKEDPKATNKQNETKSTIKKKAVPKKTQTKEKIPQVDGIVDDNFCGEISISNICQLDGNGDASPAKTRSSRLRKAKETHTNEEDVSPPKRSKTSPNPKATKEVKNKVEHVLNKSTKDILSNKTKGKIEPTPKIPRKKSPAKQILKNDISIESHHKDSTKLEDKSKTINVLLTNKDPNKTSTTIVDTDASKNKINSSVSKESISPRKTRNNTTKTIQSEKTNVIPKPSNENKKQVPPKIIVTEIEGNNSSKYFNDTKNSQENKNSSGIRKRSRTSTPRSGNDPKDNRTRTKSAPIGKMEKSKYFATEEKTTPTQNKKAKLSTIKLTSSSEDQKRISHRDLAKSRAKNEKNDVTGDLVNIIKGRIKDAKEESKKRIVKGKVKKESESDSDYLPVEESQNPKSADSDDDFKPIKISPRPSTSKNVKIDRRVLSSDEETPKNKMDVWCEVFVEELEQWIPVDVIKGIIHCAESNYNRATHPVCYVVGWDSNNYLKDLTRRYVPHWNTVTRKQRAEPLWWNKAVQLWLGPRTPRDREEDEQLDRMQLEAPLPKSIAEYKNHPLYALKRHLLKYEALYPPDAAVLGFVRKEPVYARECVYVCRSRDTWLKEAKVVRLGEEPYKVVKARPKWDKLSNKLITDKPLEIFGPWQVQDYEPPVAENGVVPRNAYGNVELFKDCMLPKGTVHIKLPGLNKVAKKLNIDCAPAMTGFDFNGGWSHPVYDGFVVCKEFEEIITEAWLKDQEEQERKEIEKIEARVYGNWRRLIKGLFIRERLKDKYGFVEPSTSQDKKPKMPRFVAKKK